MNCECEACNGEGTIVCDDCGGSGSVKRHIHSVVFDPTGKNYEKLILLQKDAVRVIKQCDELKILRPNSIDSLNQQLVATLNEIERQANKLK